jgi:hypothetical protein
MSEWKINKDKLDNALLNLSFLIPIIYEAIYSYFGTKEIILRFLLFLPLGVIMPFVIGYIFGSVLEDNNLNRARGWMYLISGIIWYNVLIIPVPNIILYILVYFIMNFIFSFGIHKIGLNIIKYLSNKVTRYQEVRIRRSGMTIMFLVFTLKILGDEILRETFKFDYNLIPLILILIFIIMYDNGLIEQTRYLKMKKINE